MVRSLNTHPTKAPLRYTISASAGFALRLRGGWKFTNPVPSYQRIPSPVPVREPPTTMIPSPMAGPGAVAGLISNVFAVTLLITNGKAIIPATIVEDTNDTTIPFDRPCAAVVVTVGETKPETVTAITCCPGTLFVVQRTFR